MAFLLGDCLLLDRLKDVNMSQAEFARKMNCQRQYVNGLIRGTEKMSLEFAINAAEILGCNVRDLYVEIPTGRRKG
ncbi:helix-turn-helix transcriptional regulator [Paenibacillus gansuensis]|uniref:Helix-turn-helix transcriptional regulator n=1 Tax=Paenibacillus gansuensis TaxID=306542 RepID=A0ABW5PG66_9BACL